MIRRKGGIGPGKRYLGYILDNFDEIVSYLKDKKRVTLKLWSGVIPHHLLGSPLHSEGLMVVFFPVPPSKRQAAGPLTENLPYVCLSDRKPVDFSLERPSPRGTMRRLSTCAFNPAPAVQVVAESKIFGASIVLCSGSGLGKNGLGGNAKRPFSNASAKRVTTRRGHLA
jgi:hypothetical protein